MAVLSTLLPPCLPSWKIVGFKAPKNVLDSHSFCVRFQISIYLMTYPPRLCADSMVKPCSGSLKDTFTFGSTLHVPTIFRISLAFAVT